MQFILLKTDVVYGCNQTVVHLTHRGGLQLDEKKLISNHLLSHVYELGVIPADHSSGIKVFIDIDVGV